MPSINTFLDIEDAMRDATLPAWQSQAKKIAKKLEEAVDKLDERIVGDAFDELDFSKAVEKSESRVRALMVSSLVYGASFADSKRKNSVFLGPDGELPDQLDQVIEVYKKIHTVAAPEVIKRRAAKVVNEAIQKEKEGQIQKADQAVVDALNNSVLGTGRMMSDIAANLTTSRLVSYGYLAQAVASGVVTYQLQATLDKRTSKVCKRLHGRVFKVQPALDHLNEVLRVTEPDQLKVMAPFVKGDKSTLHELENLSTDELQKKGIMVPPFHPGCRTILVKVGDVKITTLPYTPVLLDEAVDQNNITPVVATTTDLNAIQFAIEEAIANGFTEEEASLMHDPKNLLGFR